MGAGCWMHMISEEMNTRSPEIQILYGLIPVRNPKILETKNQTETKTRQRSTEPAQVQCEDERW